MAGFSKITLVGNLGRDPETQYTPNGKLNVKFTVAVNKPFRDQSGQMQDRTNWFRVTAWGTLAESMVKMAEQGYLAKGKQVLVDGRFEAREYTDNNGQQRTSLDVTANEFQLLGSRVDDGSSGFRGGESEVGGSRQQGSRSGVSYGSQGNQGGRSNRDDENFGPSADVDDIPF